MGLIAGRLADKIQVNFENFKTHCTSKHSTFRFVYPKYSIITVVLRWFFRVKLIARPFFKVQKSMKLYDFLPTPTTYTVLSYCMISPKTSLWLALVLVKNGHFMSNLPFHYCNSCVNFSLTWIFTVKKFTVWHDYSAFYASIMFDALGTHQQVPSLPQ